MIKKTITYSDLDGNPVTEDFWFNLSKAELVETELSYRGGLQAYIQQVVRAESGREIIKALKEIIIMSVGERDADGKRFVKSDEITSRFLHSDAYSVFFLEICTDAVKSAEFINGVVPADMAVDSTELPNIPNMIDAAKASVPQGEKTLKDYTREELLDLSQDEFDAVAGTDTKKMPQSVLAVAMQRKVLTKQLAELEEV